MMNRPESATLCARRASHVRPARATQPPPGADTSKSDARRYTSASSANRSAAASLRARASRGRT